VRFHMFNETAADRYIRQMFTDRVYNAYRAVATNRSLGIDFARYCVLYRTGGVWLERDYIMRGGLFGGVIAPNDTCVLGRMMPGHLSNHHSRRTKDALSPRSSNQYHEYVSQVSHWFLAFTPSRHSQPIKHTPNPRSNNTYHEYVPKFSHWFLAFAPNHSYLAAMIGRMVVSIEGIMGLEHALDDPIGLRNTSQLSVFTEYAHAHVASAANANANADANTRWSVIVTAPQNKNGSAVPPTLSDILSARTFATVIQEVVRRNNGTLLHREVNLTRWLEPEYDYREVNSSRLSLWMGEG
jgi:hypothetical protein